MKKGKDMERIESEPTRRAGFVCASDGLKALEEDPLGIYQEGYMMQALDRELKALRTRGLLDANGADAALVELATIAAERIDEATHDKASGGARGVPVTVIDALARILLAIHERAGQVDAPLSVDGVCWPVLGGECMNPSIELLSCGHYVEDYATFCPHCGREILRGCYHADEDAEG